MTSGADSFSGDPLADDTTGLLGQRIGNFTIESLIGEGAMGFVYRAVHDILDRRVAIKVLQPWLATNESLVSRFIEEAKTVSRLGHPNLIHVLDFGTLPSGHHYSVLEYLDGRDLETTLQTEGPQPIARIAAIGVQVASALLAVHAKGIIHRDIKPANIFLARDEAGTERVKVLDFGIATLMAGDDDTGAASRIVGTPEYMAPEQAQGGRDIDGRADVYSFGCVLYEMLTGHPPHTAESLPAILVAQCQEKAVPPTQYRRDIPPEMEAVVMRCLQKPREARFQSMAELEQALTPMADVLPPMTMERSRGLSPPLDLTEVEPGRSNHGRRLETRSRQSEARASEKLQFLVEAEFPRPVAVEFAKLRNASGVAAGPIAANVLTHLYRYCAFILAATAQTIGNRAIRVKIREALKRPMSLGQLFGLARELSDSLADLAPETPAGRIAAAFRDRQTRELLSAAIELRNEVLKKGNVDGGDELKRRAIEAARALLFLREFVLAVPTSRKERAGLEVFALRLLTGAATQSNGRLETDVGLEPGRVFLLDPISRSAVDLHPFYILSKAPGEPLMWLSRAGKLPSFEGGDGSVENRRDLLDDVAEILEGRGRSTSRQARLLTVHGLLEFGRKRLRPGDVIDERYRVVRLIGEGGMAHVYEVDDGEGGRVALKLLPYELIRDRTMVARFRREAEETAALEHPNVMPTLRFGEDCGDHYLVMPLAAGWARADGTRALDVAQLDLPLPLDRVIEIGMQISDALHYIHGRGIVHRDLKPRNVLLDAGNQVRVSDFGIARASQDITLTVTGLSIGTPEYMSPERIDGDPDLEPAADLYALGAVLFELLCGVPPYSGATPLAVMRAVATRPTPDPRSQRPDTPEPLADLVRRLLAKSPTKRPRSAREVFNALAALRGEEAAADSKVVDEQRGEPRRPASAGAAAAPPAYLEVSNGPEAGSRIPLERGRVVIGRSTDADIVVSGAMAARRHAEISSSSTGWMVEDTGSTNGTFLNGVKISQHRLATGDRLAIGSTVFVFHDRASEVPRPRLIPAAADEHAREFASDGGSRRVTLGSEPTCDVVLDSKEIAGRHAIITLAEGRGWELADCGSGGGTSLNGQPVSSAIVDAGDVIELGPFSIAVIEASGPVFDEPVEGANPIDDDRRARKKLIAPIVVSLALLMVAGGLFAYRALTNDGPSGPTLHLGVTRFVPTDELELRFAGLAEYLSGRLDRPVELVVAADADELTAMLDEGRVDLAVLSARAYVQAKRRMPGLKLVATPVNNSGVNDNGAILVPRDSLMSSVVELRGKSFCFVRPPSTSGYLMPRSKLRAAGLDPDSDLGGIHYGQNHLATLRLLDKGACDAAAVFTDAWHNAGNYRMSPDRFRPIASYSIPHDAYVAGDSVPTAHTAQLRAALLELAPESDVARVLGSHPDIAGFVAGSDDNYTTLREALEWEERGVRDKPADPLAAEIAEIERLRRAGSTSSALKRARALLEKHPDSAPLHLVSGHASMEQMWWSDGFDHYRQAIDRDPELIRDETIIENAVRALSSRTKAYFAERFIREHLGELARPALERAARDKDQNLSTRARRLLEKL